MPILGEKVFVQILIYANFLLFNFLFVFEFCFFVLQFWILPMNFLHQFSLQLGVLVT